MTVAVRPPAVAGSFYPGAADALRREVERLLADPAPAGATTGVSTAGAATTGDGPPPPDPRPESTTPSTPGRSARVAASSPSAATGSVAESTETSTWRSGSSPGVTGSKR